MKKKVTAALLLFVLLCPVRSQAFIGEAIILGKILANAIEQLTQMRNLLGTEQDTLSLLREINRGINDSLQMAVTLGPNAGLGLYGGWTTPEQALKELEALYGLAPRSGDQQIQKDADQGIAEILVRHTALHAYTEEIDVIGEQIKAYSHAVSPGGAQKLTAQALGVILHVLNESMRTQAAGLKLQAQNLAIENRREKEMTAHLATTSGALSAALKSDVPEFQLPRFSR